MKPSICEPMLAHEQPDLWLPSTGTDGTGKGIGSAWTVQGGVVVSHPALGNAFTTQFPRTRFTSDATANRHLGVYKANADQARLWRGNAASRGGFYFSARFMVNAIPDTAVRFFCGLSAQVGTGVCTANVPPNNSIGLWCASGDAGSLTVVVVDNAGTVVNIPLLASNGTPTPLTLTAGALYEFVIHCNPNQNVLVTNLFDLTSGAGKGTLIRTQNNNANPSPNTKIPLNTAFMAPQVGLGNAAHAGGGDCSLDIISIYSRPNLLLTPLGTP